MWTTRTPSALAGAAARSTSDVPKVLVDGFPAFEVRSGTTLLEACEEGDVPMESACGGFAACNSCRVTVLEGAAGLGPLLEEEEPFLDRPEQRLGCQCIVSGDVHVALFPGM